MVSKLKAFAVIALCLPLLGAWPNTGKKYSPGAAYSGPGDVVSGASAWYGLRAYTAALASGGPTTTPVIDVLGATTATGCTIYLKGDGTGDLDFTTSGAGGVGHQCASGAATFCTVTNTSCSISKAYDQSVSGACTGTCNVVQATAGLQPKLAFSCLGSLPCMQPVVAQSFGLVAAAANTTTVQPFTIAQVAERTGNFSANGAIIGCGTNGFNAAPAQAGFANASNNALIFAGNVVSVAGATDSVNHALQYVYNGASSEVDIDNTITTGLNPGANNCTSGSGLIAFSSGGNTTTGNIGEAGIWPIGFSTTQLNNVQANLKAYWGTP